MTETGTDSVDEGVAEAVVQLSGEIDHGALPRVRAELEGGLARLPQVLVVDLDGVTFIDSTGLGALVAVKKRLATWSGALRVVNPPPQARQLLRLTGLDGHFGL